MKVVIMAGGRGTRIASVASDVPKPMIPIDGIPVLEREIENLKNQGFKDIIITVGYKSNVIIEYFGDGSKISPVSGKTFGVNIEYYIEEEPLGNAGALFKITQKLSSDFLLLNADAAFDIDFNRICEYHKKRNALVTLFTHPNNHPYDSGLVITSERDEVIQWLTKEEERPEFYKNRVNAGIHVVSKKLFQESYLQKFFREGNVNEKNKVDLDRDILKPLSGTGKMIVYNSPEYVKDMGTPERLNMVIQDYKDGIVSGKNLCKSQRAIFLDRDGVINKYKGFLKNIKDFELLPNVSKAIKMINNSGYLAIVITNQPVIARGEVTVVELETIHNKMETLLGLEGAYLDAIYYCPHHPDRGFDGEVKELKVLCECRKPKPGMIINAAKEYNIDLTKSWMIGDSDSDMIAGKAAGCKCIFIGDEEKYICKSNLYTAIEYILNS